MDHENEVSLMSGTIPGKDIMGQREKYWSELAIEEKLERLREQVKSTSRVLIQNDSIVSRLRKKFFNHRHDIQTGDITARIEEYDSYDSGPLLAGSLSKLGRNDKEVYF